MADEGRRELTIDELAQRTGMSARNIRAHQSRGLLAPPTLRGRTGYYNDDHVARITIIQELQADGYSLELIQRLVRSAGDSTEDVLRFSKALHEPFGDERPRVIERSELQQQFHSTATEPLNRALELGLLRSLGDGNYEQVTPSAWEGAQAFADLGVDVDAIVTVAGEVREHLDAIANAFVRLFADYVWRPFEEAGEARDGLDHLLEAIERLRPLALATIQSMFQMAMGEAAEKRLGSELQRQLEQRSRDAAG